MKDKVGMEWISVDSGLGSEVPEIFSEKCRFLISNKMISSCHILLKVFSKWKRCLYGRCGRKSERIQGLSASETL